MTPPMTTREKTADHVTDDRKMVADHAELAALIQDLRDSRTVWDNARARPKEIETRAADAIENLLSEIAALKGADARTGELLAESNLRESRATVRATQAERQRDELRKALEEIARATPTSTQSKTAHDMAEWSHCRAVLALCASTSIANQGADQSPLPSAPNLKETGE